MNPFFMNNFFNMGMGCSPFIPTMGCGNFFMTMPCYQNDILSFLNFPIYRNTSMDYLLDPNLALKQCQIRWQQGDFGPGCSFLPGFTFPQIGPLPGLPGLPGSPSSTTTKPKTEEEKEAEKKKAEEAKKPAAITAKAAYDQFNKIKELAKDSKNNIDELDDELIQKADEAMKKETAAEQLAEMKEVMEAIPAEIIRKSILADDKVSLELYKAGYNFNLKDNYYSVPFNKYGQQEDYYTAKRINNLISDIKNKEFHEFMIYASLFADPKSDGKNNILPVISTWNDHCAPGDKGLIRAVAANLPENNGGVLARVEKCTVLIVESLLNKASEYSNDSCPKIKADKDALRRDLDALCVANTKRQNASDDQKASALEEVKKAMIKVADSFDKLYVRLRMQEAVRIREDIKSNKEFKRLEEVKPGVLTDTMIVEETIKDLKTEGFENNIPAESDLDPLPKKTTIRIENKAEDRKADKEYKSAQEKIDKYLVEEKGYLSKVSEDGNVYKTTSLDGNGKDERYFTVQDDKIVEATKKDDGTFEVADDAKEVSAEEIGKYHNALATAKELIDAGKIVDYRDELNVECKYPVFKSVVDNKFFIIKDNEFAMIEDCTGIKVVDGELVAEGVDKKLDELDSNKLDTSIKPEKLRTIEDKKRDDKKASEKDIGDVVSASSGKSLDDIKNIEFCKKYNIEPAAVNGYFKSTNGKNRFYAYNPIKKKLSYLPGVTEIRADGRMIRNGKVQFCTEVGNPTDFGSSLANNIYGLNLNANNYTTAKRNLNAFLSYNEPENIVKFIEGYNAEKGMLEDDMVEQIICKDKLSKIKTRMGNKTLTYGQYYLMMIAKQMLKVIKKTSGFTTQSPEYINLEKIAKGEFIEKTATYASGTTMPSTSTVKYKDELSTAKELDKIIKSVTEAYRAQHPNSK